MELADAADRIALRYFRHNPRVDRKPDRTFVTQADTAIEKALRERIEAQYPSHGILAEEFGDRSANQEVRWIIDPIDATHSYLRGVPDFATLIALERGGRRASDRLQGKANLRRRKCGGQQRAGARRDPGKAEPGVTPTRS